MRRRLVLIAPFVLVLALASCQSGAPVAGNAQRLVMVSYDGVGADLAWRWIEHGTAAKGLAPMAELGFAVDRVRPMDPTVTAVNHVALITGRPPAQTGIVGNVFRPASAPITETVSGFSAPIATETLVQAVRRQGGRVGVLLWPGCDGIGDDRSGDFGLRWPESALAPSEIVELVAESAQTGGGAPSQDGVEALEWSLETGTAGIAEPAVWTWTVALVDGTPDGIPRHDTLAVRGPEEQGWRFLLDLEWFPLEVSARGSHDDQPGRYGAWCKVLGIDRHGRSVRLYRGAFYRLLAYPEAWATQLADTVGFWPGPPDDRLLAEWWIDVGTGLDLDSYLEQVERFDRYLDAIAEQVIDHEDFRLLLAYHPTPDEYQHSSLIVDPRQWPYSAGSEVAAREGLRRVGRSVDASVAALWRGLEAERDALVVVSDHGLMPRYDSVNLNQALAEAGLVTLEADGSTAADSPMRAVASGGSGHIYLNLAGSTPAGVVVAASAGDLLGRAARALADVSVEGEPVVERVVDRAEAAALGLDNAASGDLVVFLYPGYGAARGPGGPTIAPSRTYGDHGHLSHHRSLHAMLFARGAGIPRERRGELRTTDVAGLVAGWLGLAFP